MLYCRIGAEAGGGAADRQQTAGRLEQEQFGGIVDPLCRATVLAF